MQYKSFISKSKKIKYNYNIMNKFLILLAMAAVATAAHALMFSSTNFNYETISDEEVKITGLTTTGKSLTTVTIGSTVTYNTNRTTYRIVEIADGAFKMNDAMTTCDMSSCNYLKRIGEEAFMNTRVNTVKVKATAIGTKAFYGSHLANIELLDGVQEIDSYAFSACSNLKSLTIPSTVTSIAQTTFVDNCINLTEVVVDTKK